MAIVFISPKANQRTFLKVTAMALLLILVVAFLTFSSIIFLGKNRDVGVLTVPTQKNISINFDIIDSPEVSNLKPFYKMESAFSYVVIDEVGKEIKGNISAGSIEYAKALLQASGFTISNLKEVGIGRIQPFILY